MTAFKRWGIFLTTNLLVLFALSALMLFLGIKTEEWTSLLALCAVFGFAGSIISLLLSKTMAKAGYKIQLINRDNASGKALFLYDSIEKMAAHKGIRTPEVGIYNSNDANAFATGASKNKSLIAFSSGILNSLNEEEISAVAAHEMTHITEGDMVTTTLLMGMINTFVMFAARIIAGVLSGMGRSNRDGDTVGGGMLGGMGYFLVVMLIQNVLMIFANIALAAHSRHREYAADYGAAVITNPSYMITALEKISQNYVPDKQNDAYSIAKINSKKYLSLFATHPPVAKRIERLQKMMV